MSEKVIKTDLYNVVLLGAGVYKQINTLPLYHRLFFLNDTGTDLTVKLNDALTTGTLKNTAPYDSGDISSGSLCKDKVEVAGVGTLLVQQQYYQFV